MHTKATRETKTCDSSEGVDNSNYLGAKFNLFKCLLVEPKGSRKIKIVSVLFLGLFLALDLFPTVETLKTKHGTFTVISAKPCQNALGQVGTCMFMWDCIKSEGLHLGTCSDRFLFGSCCHHNASSDTDVDIQRPSATPVAHLIQQTSNLSHVNHLAINTNQMALEQQTTTPFLQSSSSMLSDHFNSMANHSRPASDVQSASAAGGAFNPIQLDEPSRNKSTANNLQTLEFHNNQQGAIPVKQTLPIESTTTASGSSQAETKAPQKASQNATNNDDSLAFHPPSADMSNPLQTKKPPPTITTTTSQPLSSEHTSNQIVNQQQPGPVKPNQSSSWFSRPSLLANAIFHSFKPFVYPFPNRHRPPTYRPPPVPSNGLYRPALNQQQQQQHIYRPIVQHQQRPQMVIPMNGLVDTTSKQPTVSAQQSGQGQNLAQDNSDHHVVAPMASSNLTQRYRPLPGNLLNSDQQKQIHYELLSNATAASSQNSVSNETSSTPTQPCPNCLEHDTISVQASHLAAPQQQSTVSTNSLAGEAQQFSLGIVSQKPALILSPVVVTLTPPPLINANNFNQSANYPAYPLISQAPFQHQSNNNIDNMIPYSTSLSPIDEIHGLFVSSSDNDNQPASVPNVVHPSVHEHQHEVLNNSVQEQQFPGSTTLNQHPTLQHQNVIESIPSFGGFNQQPTASLISSVSTTTTQATSSPATNSNAQTIPVGTSLNNKTSLHPSTTTPVSPDNLSSTVASSTTMATTTEEPKRNQPHKEVACGVAAVYPQTKVVGGKNAAFGAWPWQVSVRKVSFFGFSSTHRCGGAVISSEWIATAGHCVEDLALQSIRIRVGEYDFSTVSEPYPHIERAARRKVVHPKYNFYTYENDLALVQLDQPLQFPPHITPICLPPDNIDLLGRNATVTGWGRLNEGGTLPTILQEVRVPIVSNDKCKDMFLNAGRPEYIPDIFLCAGYEEGGRDSCQGDSGGPLQVRGDDGKWFLAGIISWGIGCAEQNLPGVCTRISRFKLWIQSTMNSNG